MAAQARLFLCDLPASPTTILRDWLYCRLCEAQKYFAAMFGPQMALPAKQNFAINVVVNASFPLLLVLTTSTAVL